MRILGIETSCDETAASVVEDGVRVLSHVVASSEELHRKTGGIVPEVAAREQVRSIIPVVDESLKQAAIDHEGLDAIAVTVGPGLIGSLLVGVETAKTLAWVWGKPLIPINHLVAHIYAPFLELEKFPEFPAVCLMVSGGHTDLVLMRGHSLPRAKRGGDFKWLGGTLDDAAGECFDKVARILGLGYPGGPAISRAATDNNQAPITNNAKIILPRPLIHEDNFDFSFSGLKTAVMRLAPTSNTSAVAYEFQEAVTDVLAVKTIKAAEKFSAKSIIVGGGVAANQRLREKLGECAGNVPVFFPALKYCGDNGAMVAGAAYFNFKSVRDLFKVEADPGLYFG